MLVINRIAGIAKCYGKDEWRHNWTPAQAFSSLINFALWPKLPRRYGPHLIHVFHDVVINDRVGRHKVFSSFADYLFESRSFVAPFSGHVIHGDAGGLGEIV